MVTISPEWMKWCAAIQSRVRQYTPRFLIFPMVCTASDVILVLRVAIDAKDAERYHHVSDNPNDSLKLEGWLWMARCSTMGISQKQYDGETSMPVIDMSTLEPGGEFGSKAWGDACAEASIKILEAANLPSTITWAFSEDYTHPPARLMEGGREKAGYYIMVKEGKVTAGDGIPDEVLKIPGFHVRIPWGCICNQSGALYGREGQQQRTADQQVLYAAITEYVGRENPFGLEINSEGKPNQFLDPVGPWPPEVGAALGEGGEEGNGLHNIAATLQSDSPEYADLPVTALRVPVFADMTDQQKADYVKLCGIEM